MYKPTAYTSFRIRHCLSLDRIARHLYGTSVCKYNDDVAQHVVIIAKFGPSPLSLTGKNKPPIDDSCDEGKEQCLKIDKELQNQNCMTCECLYLTEGQDDRAKRGCRDTRQ